jgi:hypothetical protein
LTTSRHDCTLHSENWTIVEKKQMSRVFCILSMWSKCLLENQPLAISHPTLPLLLQVDNPLLNTPVSRSLLHLWQCPLFGSMATRWICCLVGSSSISQFKLLLRLV